MSITTLFLAVIASIVVWFFLHKGSQPSPGWKTGPIDDSRGAFSLPTAKLGLGVFLAVVTVLFMLLIIAYAVRMALEDWRPAPPPRLLWLNTGMLVLSSVAMQWAQIAARRGEDWTA